ncbi:TlpA disulfide reductase family protein [Aporhodopirellula aestuarii]|uniref:TlpA family protein disulfide reductase n=1 Tax=Aporhodopirellula aestuarii TaxID=2950107 RepID=A0ABT0U8S4_9BACT|nr:TlpA disulfide reductase family protein [Aporhodopirellula aestuarii]MCM2373089.1 TlpA family protein disulfide reductase [Aporhodopirellula aestuarii]
MNHLLFQQSRCLLPTALSLGVIVSLLCCNSSAHAAPPSAAAALGLKPVQAGVEYDEVAGDQIARCEVRDIERKDWSGWEVIAADGTLLRRFADTNGDKKVDLWSYFQYGVEVYRDVDANFNGKADQYRWMATGGSRWGLDSDEDGVIDQWKMISAEETTMELIAALATADANRFALLLASPNEIKSVGITGDMQQSLSKKAVRAASKFKEFAASQKVIDRNAKWLQFAATTPGVMPAGEPGFDKDVVAYENAVAMFESGDHSGQLFVGTILRTGDTWKLLDLPVVAENGEAIAQSGGNFFTPGGTTAPTTTGSSVGDVKTQQLVSQLEAIDSQLVRATETKDLAVLNAKRADVVESLVDAAATPDERDTWTRQLVDTVSVAVQSGAYPDGLVRLQALARSLAKSNSPESQSLRAYTEYQLIGTEYIARQSPNADFAKIQEWWLGELTEFTDRYPRAPETAQAKLQLALSKEFEGNEKDALKLYKEVATDFSGTDTAERAAGAVVRLQSVGRVVELEGHTIQGKSFRLSQMRGRPIVLHYWATWCEPCKQDMKRLRGLQARYQRAGLQLVGVNIDNSRDQAIAYLKENSVPWIQLYEDGGLEGSPLAKQFGVQTLPTMMLIDSKGRVVRHNVGEAELDEELAELLK